MINSFSDIIGLRRVWDRFRMSYAGLIEKRNKQVSIFFAVISSYFANSMIIRIILDFFEPFFKGIPDGLGILIGQYLYP